MSAFVKRCTLISNEAALAFVRAAALLFLSLALLLLLHDLRQLQELLL